MDLFVTKSKRHHGFTLIELIVVIIILGIIAIIAMPKFINLRQDAETATHEATGGAFKGGITLANVKWAAAGNSGPADNLQVFGGGASGQLDINLWGFPAQNYPPLESSPRLNNTNDCMSVWRTILEDAPLVSNSADTVDAVYRAVYQGPDQCYFYYLPEQTMSIYYDSRDGSVITDSDPNS
ncbi:prepilin-type N-terminal cleavage/methylation domain-containing protein [Shewanella sp. GutDb-MelDb]|uniref:prepilin-type N-terminal cleavage/methylation domain-containing protein n=1 Tax=Shewanella sp. GutDb-MelDb TaxID=2058316 RepID=UPI000C7A0F37|nr:prepilin-type N-terminal cleavage/methylation domain-containing protein [Shewanella sp. GutDb-MelDb]PKG57870.1 pilin [Shewanella sp. GutDb-MelDb]